MNNQEKVIALRQKIVDDYVCEYTDEEMEYMYLDYMNSVNEEMAFLGELTKHWPEEDLLAMHRDYMQDLADAQNRIKSKYENMMADEMIQAREKLTKKYRSRARVLDIMNNRRAA